MKIDINRLKLIPKGLSTEFGLCVYGPPDGEIDLWIKVNELIDTEYKGYTNIYFPPNTDLSKLFNDIVPYEWMDAFSPNLNKELHAGHFSNLVIGKAFRNLDIAKQVVANYGDTLESKGLDLEAALNIIEEYRKLFDFKADLSYVAFELVSDELDYTLKEGTAPYQDTYIFEIGDEKIVAIKSDGSTTYFYQDVVLATILHARTLYLTGREQNNHFRLLKLMFPDQIDHLGLGLLMISNRKMSSRDGNTMLMKEVINELSLKFDNNIELAYNIFAGSILKSDPVVGELPTHARGDGMGFRGQHSS